MSQSELATQIESAWERRDTLTPQSGGADRDAVEAALALLDSGEARVASRSGNGEWTTQQWLKKAVLLSFRLSANRLYAAETPGYLSGQSTYFGHAWDKVPQKTAGWVKPQFEAAAFVWCQALWFGKARMSPRTWC